MICYVSSYFLRYFRIFISLISSILRGFTRHILIIQVVQKSPSFLQPKTFHNRSLSFTTSCLNPIYKHKLCFCKVFYNRILNFSVSSVAGNVTEDTFTDNRIKRQALSVGQKKNNCTHYLTPHKPGKCKRYTYKHL
jgi:hypothetical protein